MAVSRDERFHTVKGVRWHFWIVSNSYDDFARSDIEGGPDPARQLIHRKDNISVGIKTWGELIEENRARLQFFQAQLQHSAEESADIRYLQERHHNYRKAQLQWLRTPPNRMRTIADRIQTLRTGARQKEDRPNTTLARALT